MQYQMMIMFGTTLYKHCNRGKSCYCYNSEIPNIDEQFSINNNESKLFNGSFSNPHRPIERLMKADRELVTAETGHSAGQTKTKTLMQNMKG